MTWTPSLLRLEIEVMFQPLTRYQLESPDAIRRQEKLRWWAIQNYRARHLDWQQRNRDHVREKGQEYEEKQKTKPDYQERKRKTSRASSRKKNVLAWQEEDLRCLCCGTPFRRKFQSGRPTKYCGKKCKRKHIYQQGGKEQRTRRIAAQKEAQT